MSYICPALGSSEIKTQATHGRNPRRSGARFACQKKSCSSKHMGRTAWKCHPSVSPVLTPRAFFALQSVESRLCFRVFVIQSDAKDRQKLSFEKTVPRTNLQHPFILFYSATPCLFHLRAALLIPPPDGVCHLLSTTRFHNEFGMSMTKIAAYLAVR
jgi:hypothetical protein